jgi:transcriptional regulator with XRE-family HTH domain
VPHARRKGDSSFLSHLGESVQKARKRAAISQEALAERIGVTPRYVQKAGEVNPPATTLSRLREALGASWNALMTGRED